MKFNELPIEKGIISALESLGFNEMFPIQENAIPPMLEGRNVLGQAKTGTGKTASFGVPMIQVLDPSSRYIEGLIIAPTRELAQQITEDINNYAKNSKVWATPIYGGVSIQGQIRELKKKPTIIVGTPGRIIDHIKRGNLNLKKVRIVALDEADRMFDMGFYEDIEYILNKLPKKKQVSLWSATFDKRTYRLSSKFMPKFVEINMSRDEIALTSIEQYYIVTAHQDKMYTIEKILEHFNIDRALVFCRTKKTVDRLSSYLKRAQISAEPLHGDFTQARRLNVLNGFRKSQFKLLIATELAARGLDIDNVPFIINYDIPDDPYMYFHRIGRTARAGKKGTAITLMVPDQEIELERIKAVTKTTLNKFSLPPSFLF